MMWLMELRRRTDGVSTVCLLWSVECLLTIKEWPIKLGGVPSSEDIGSSRLAHPIIFPDLWAGL